MLTDLTPTLVGAALGFLAALLLSAVVGPLVQARTRRVERWENAVSEMAALVAVEIEKAIDQLWRAGRIEAGVRSGWQSRGVDPENPNRRARLDMLRTERTTADAAVNEMQARLARLHDVVRQRLRQEDRTELEVRVGWLMACMTLLWGGCVRLDDGDADFDALPTDIDDLRARAQTAREQCASFLVPIGLTMRPPRPVGQLLRKWIGPWFRWLRWPYRRLRAWAMRRLAASRRARPGEPK